MRLVDTSCWIELLRSAGRPEVQERLRELLKLGQAAWCPVIKLELWAGAGNDRDLRQLLELEQYVTTLEMTEDVWKESVMLARFAKSKGTAVSATDLMIAACARVHGVPVESVGGPFETLVSQR